jgi:glycosyltransferase involved in cell wall biosynthesis
MRILHVIPTYLPATRYGGPIFTVHALARALIARGHDVEVVTTNVNGAGVSPVPLGTRVEIDSVPVRYFASPWLPRLCFAPAMASMLRAEMPRFLPRAVLGADKAYLYRTARVFVLPSFSENFGNTVLEAMQSGRPVVVTPEVGAAEIVCAAGGGVIADGDPASFGAAIDRLLADRALADAMGAAGRRYVCANLSWARVAADMEALYEAIRFSRRAGAARPIVPRARDAHAPLAELQRS